MVRSANDNDISRIAEILVFGKRTAYRDIFHDDTGTFGEMQVLPVAQAYLSGKSDLRDVYVYDDGIIKGMLSKREDGADRLELCELYVEPVFRGEGVGSALIRRFLQEARDKNRREVGLWVLEDNPSARKFYDSFGFTPNGEKRLVAGTDVTEVRYTMQIDESEKALIQTERLYLREMAQSDFDALAKMLMDPDVMYAYNGPFTKEETQGWLERQFARYENDGFGLWAVCLRDTGEMIGQCGLTMQPWKDRRLLEVGYLFQKAYWHKGYAAEAAIACKEYAFTKLNADEVHSIIRDTNTASQNVAKRNGMTEADRSDKVMRGATVPHILYRVKRNP